MRLFEPPSLNYGPRRQVPEYVEVGPRIAAIRHRLTECLRTHQRQLPRPMLRSRGRTRPAGCHSTPRVVIKLKENGLVTFSVLEASDPSKLLEVLRICSIHVKMKLLVDNICVCVVYEVHVDLTWTTKWTWTDVAANITSAVPAVSCLRPVKCTTLTCEVYHPDLRGSGWYTRASLPYQRK
ncbi:hypothetical protein MRX96_050408 [Rhipicephalus microplus]